MPNASVSTRNLAYIGEAQTANGTVETAPSTSTFDSVTIGDIRDERCPPWSCAPIWNNRLMGMSYLSRFACVSIEGNRLIPRTLTLPLPGARLLSCQNIPGPPERELRGGQRPSLLLLALPAAIRLRPVFGGNARLQRSPLHSRARSSAWGHCRQRRCRPAPARRIPRP